MRSPSILSKLSDLKATNPAAMSNLAFKCGGRSENQSGSENDNWRRFVSGMLKVQGFRDLCIKLEILDAINNSMLDLSVWQASIDAMVGFWCEETNTFVLDFGETTVTIEDAHVLGKKKYLGGPSLYT